MQKNPALSHTLASVFWLLVATTGHAQDIELAEPPPPEEMGLEPIAPAADSLGATGVTAPTEVEAGVPPAAEPSAALETSPPSVPAAPRRRFIDRTREPRPWPGPYLGIRLTAAGGAGLFPLADASAGGATAGFMPIIAPYLGLEFGYTWRAFGAAIHLEGTGLTLPLSGQGEIPQHILLGLDLLYIPAPKWRFLAGVEILDFVRMTSGLTGDSFWSKGFGLRLGTHYRLADWAEGISPSLLFHAAFHSYPVVEALPTGSNPYTGTSASFVGGGLSSLSVLGFFGLQVDFQL